MWRILEKWLNLEPVACPVCEVLRDQLDKSEMERRELLQRALAPSTPVVEHVDQTLHVPIQPAFVPWRVRQQLLENEDRKANALLKEKKKEMDDLKGKDRSAEIQKLERELGLEVAADVSSPSGGIMVSDTGE